MNIETELDQCVSKLPEAYWGTARSMLANLWEHRDADTESVTHSRRLSETEWLEVDLKRRVVRYDSATAQDPVSRTYWLMSAKVITHRSLHSFRQ